MVAGIYVYSRLAAKNDFDDPQDIKKPKEYFLVIFGGLMLS